MFDNLQTDATIIAETDNLGGYNALDSGLYDFAIDMAYIDKSSGGAMSLNLTLKTAQGQTLKQTIWVTSGDAKGNLNYYMVKKNGQETGEKRYLPGFNQANAICLLSIGKEISQLESEEKMINVYDFTQSKEVPQKKKVLVELLGADITLGVIKQVVDKNVKNSAGDYVPGGETREENEIDKAFRTRDGLTVAEITAEETEAAFKAKWEEKNAGTVRNKAKGATANAGTAGAPAANAPAAGGSNSLFAQ